jgi:hypothetical protein
LTPGHQSPHHDVAATHAFGGHVSFGAPGPKCPPYGNVNVSTGSTAAFDIYQSFTTS